MTTTPAQHPDPAPQSPSCPGSVTVASPGEAQDNPLSLNARPGDILHVRTKSPLGWAIRRAIGSWGCHDAIIVPPYYELAAGDATIPKAVCTPLAHYWQRILRGKCKAVLLRPADIAPDQGRQAAQWWLQNVQGKPYDIAAYPRLLAKAIVGDLCPWPAGWEWAWYCTESCRDAYLHACGLDLWGKNNPTPRTTEKRYAEGKFIIVWSTLALSTPAFSLTQPNYTPERLP